MDNELPDESSGGSEAPEGEAELFQQFAQTGSPEVQEKIVSRYSGLVVAMVRKFKGRAEWEDLVQVGYVGLLKAINAYKPSTGNRFSTYASHCVMGELRHYLRDRTETVRRPRWLVSVSRQVGSFVETFLQQNERLPTIAEISQGCNINREGVVEVLKAGSTISLEQLQSEAAGGGVQLGRIRSLREESFVLSLEDRIWIESSLQRLLEVERYILKMFFYRDLNQSQIAGETGLSPKRVSRIMRRALSRLQSAMGLANEDSEE
jgi:RNA polymerase sigma-B factor